MGLYEAFSFEISFPQAEGCWAFFKDMSIPYFPNVPSCNYENFYEEVAVRLCLVISSIWNKGFPCCH